MVQKSAHRGVYSGNTLRASNSRYRRRYHNHACIVSRINARLLSKLGDGVQPDAPHNISKLGYGVQPDAPHNISVNVALSLNKQARWLLPSALKQQIISNSLGSSDLAITLLERHKLKRHDNCISFHSNIGPVRRIQPRNGRYFGFAYPTADGKSRRALRREKIKLLKESKSAAKADGDVIHILSYANEMLGSDITEDVRYEVYYPCPVKSSISHNPKYIKQNVSLDDGDHVGQGKLRKKHQGKQRKRMMLKDIEDWDYPALDFDEAVFKDLVEENDKVCPSKDYRPTEYLLTSLIDKAERVQQVLNAVTTPQRKTINITPASRKHQYNVHVDEDKSHIIYIDGLKTEKEEREQSSPLTLPPFPTAASESTRIVLSKKELSVGNLTQYFGQQYFEAACKPRKFVLDITDPIRELLKRKDIKPRIADTCEAALSFLILVHDGIYDDDLEVFKVFLNSKLHDGLLAVQLDATQELYQGTLQNLVIHTVDFVDGMFPDLKDSDVFKNMFDRMVISKSTSARQIKHHLASSNSYLPSVQRIFKLGSPVTEVTSPSMEEMINEDNTFCDVCYDDVSLLILGSAAATSLTQCGHRVCDKCWTYHVLSRLQQGFVRITCPGYDCQAEADVGVMLSLVPLETVDTLCRRQEEVRISGSLTEKWCPGEGCGRVLHFRPCMQAALRSEADVGEEELQQDVICECGVHVCFHCLKPAHWPASCEQAESYRSCLTTTVFPSREDEVYDDSEAEKIKEIKSKMEAKKMTVVEGKHCPFCKTFVEKNGGCSNLYCRCGHTFCWLCGRPGNGHAPGDLKCIKVDDQKKLKTTVIFRHVDNIQSLDEKNWERKPASRRLRVSLLERAFEHRRRKLSLSIEKRAIDVLAKTITFAASKDASIAQYIMQAVTSAADTRVPYTSTPHPTSHSKPVQQMQETVSSFLKNVARTKQEVLEVAEYTLVLLRDVPDSLLRQRALRIVDDLGAFCTFIQSVLDFWRPDVNCKQGYQEAVKAVEKLADIQRWIGRALATHVTTIRRLRTLSTSVSGFE